MKQKIFLVFPAVYFIFNIADIPSTISTRVTETQFIESDFTTQPPTQSSLKTDPDAVSLGSKKRRGKPAKRHGKAGPGRGHKKIIPGNFSLLVHIL